MVPTGSDGNANVVEFERPDNLYGFVLLYPELCRARHGTYWNGHLLMAGGVFILNIVLQVTLIHFTGSDVLSKTMDHRHRLLADYEPVEDREQSLLEKWGLVTAEETPCCHGHRCLLKGLQCCPSAKATTANSSTLLSSKRASFVEAGHSPQPSLHSGRQKRRGRGQEVLGEVAREVVSFLGKTANASSAKISAVGKSKTLQEMEDAQAVASLASLCVNRNGILDCAQPAYSIIDRWEDLDFNGDGYWTRQEAASDEANVACRIAKGITLEQIFNGVVKGINQDIQDMISAGLAGSWAKVREVEERSAVPKSSFEIWRGVVALCSSRDVGRCGSLITDGLLDGFLRAENVKGKPMLLENALDFCTRLLEPGGSCEVSHPVTYILWRQHGSEMCGSPAFRGGTAYQNPFVEDDVLDALTVKYSSTSTYELANSLRFQFFVCCILFIWFVTLVTEFDSILSFAEFLRLFPTSTEDPFATAALFRRMRSSVTRAVIGDQVHLAHQVSEVTRILSRKLDGERIQLKAICRVQKVVSGITVATRLILLIYMGVVGTIFLLTTYSYTDLLMNAVALAFVFELPELLYNLLVGQREKKEMELIDPLTYVKKDGWSFIPRVMKSRSFWGLMLFPGISVAIVWANAAVNTFPVEEALQCACYQKGPRCLTKDTLKKDWWDKHWSLLLPR